MSVAGASAGAAMGKPRQVSRKTLRTVGIAIGLLGIVLAAILSLRIGSIDVSTREAWDALFNYNADSYDQTVVRFLRGPRTVVALAIGAALGVAGATMQGVTQNPLADPFILGVSAGASFAIVAVVYYLRLTSPSQYLWFAFAGAMGASLLVFAIGSAGRDGPTPIKLALSGVVVSSALSAWTSAMLLLDKAAFDVVRFWVAGSVVNRDMGTFALVAPFLIGGALACIFLGGQLNVLSLGEDTARALGMRTGRTRIIAAALVVIITGAAVAVAGPIGFVGLAVPHMVRRFTGPDYRWVLPFSFLFGAIFLTVADVFGRVITRPAELDVGIVTALVGAPFLVLLARRQGGGTR